MTGWSWEDIMNAPAVVCDYWRQYYRAHEEVRAEAQQPKKKGLLRRG